VEDTGIGIAPEHIKKVFDPFFTTKDPGEGTGLGLALCYGIVQDLKGTMTVESTVNIGTRFIIEIPMEGLALAEAAEAEPLSTKSGKPRSVP
jgi:two-component system NtrC family sensor kinase